MEDFFANARGGTDSNETAAALAAVASLSSNCDATTEQLSVLFGGLCDYNKDGQTSCTDYIYNRYTVTFVARCGIQATAALFLTALYVHRFVFALQRPKMHYRKRLHIPLPILMAVAGCGLFVESLDIGGLADVTGFYVSFFSDTLGSSMILGSLAVVVFSWVEADRAVHLRHKKEAQKAKRTRDLWFKIFCASTLPLIFIVLFMELFWLPTFDGAPKGMLNWVCTRVKLVLAMFPSATSWLPGCASSLASSSSTPLCLLLLRLLPCPSPHLCMYVQAR